MSVRRGSSGGQALVEFSLAIGVFLMILMGLIDFGRVIYQYNAVSQAAREIARVTSVHPGTTLGSSQQTLDVIATQKATVPGLEDPEFFCVDPVTDAVMTAEDCRYVDDSVRVTITAPFEAIAPLLSLTGAWTLQGTSSAKIQ